QWEALDGTGICKHSSAHRRFQEWGRAGVFEQFWIAGLLGYEELEGIDWNWVAMDGAMTKAPLGGEKNRAQPNRPRQKRGQTQPLDRRPGHPRGRGGCRSQSQRPPAGPRNFGKHPDRASPARRRSKAKPLSGQGLRLSRSAAAG